MTDRLALPPRYRDQLEALLSEHVPGVEVWAYGSRVNGSSDEGSDLDLALRSPTLEPLGDGFYDLLEAIENSNIPFLVQAHDWAMLPESFHREIERDYVVVQKGAKQTRVGGWTEVMLGEVAQVRSGFAFKSKDWTDSGIPVVRIANVKDGTLVMDGCAFVSPQVAAQANQFNLSEGDILIALTGYVGEVAMVRHRDLPAVLNQRVGMFSISDTSMLDRGYLFQLLRVPNVREYIDGLAYGSAQPNISPSLIHGVTVLLPPLPTQRAIAHILGTLDDKIELNRRMNETLEEMARALFKSWFVDFEPVRAKMEGRWQQGESLPGLPAHLYDLFPERLVDSELGEIPAGWRVGNLGEVGNQRRSGASPEEIDPTTPYIALEHMPKQCIALSDWGTADGLASNKFRFKRGDILFGKLRPYFHKVGVAPLNGVCSTDIVVISPVSKDWFSFLLGHMSSREFVDYTSAGSTGTKMPRTSWPDMARYQIALPHPVVVEAFNQRLCPATERMLAATHESRSLAAQRDALLPGLVSGEVAMEGLSKL